jgi:Flp pilus assembly protein TadG
MKSLRQIWLRARRSAASLIKDRRGIAATEFAFIVPIMLVMFFGTVEFSSGIAVDRKVTLMARMLADLTSQSVSVANSDLKTLQARVQWSQGAAPRGTSSPVAIPAAMAAGGTYLLFSEVSYLYVPAVGYVMAKAGITLHDVAYTRPRQSLCVFYPTTNPLPANCPTL